MGNFKDGRRSWRRGRGSRFGPQFNLGHMDFQLNGAIVIVADMDGMGLRLDGFTMYAIRVHCERGDHNYGGGFFQFLATEPAEPTEPTNASMLDISPAMPPSSVEILAVCASTVDISSCVAP